MNKLKKVYEFIKEKLQNKRTRAATILSLYLIFFIFVFIFIKSVPNSSNKYINNEQKTNYSNIQKEYKYNQNIEYKKTNETLKFMISGIKTNEEQTEEIKLYNEDSNSYEIMLDYEIINPLLLDLETIISYINNLDSEFSTNYKDGTIQKNYLLHLNIIDSNLDNKDNIEINVYEKDNFITKIVIDGTNLDKLNDGDIIDSKYSLEYEKIED